MENEDSLGQPDGRIIGWSQQTMTITRLSKKLYFIITQKTHHSEKCCAITVKFFAFFKIGLLATFVRSYMFSSIFLRATISTECLFQRVAKQSLFSAGTRHVASDHRVLFGMSFHPLGGLHAAQRRLYAVLLLDIFSFHQTYI